MSNMSSTVDVAVKWGGLWGMYAEFVKKMTRPNDFSLSVGNSMIYGLHKTARANRLLAFPGNERFAMENAIISCIRGVMIIDVTSPIRICLRSMTWCTRWRKDYSLCQGMSKIMRWARQLPTDCDRGKNKLTGNMDNKGDIEPYNRERERLGYQQPDTSDYQQPDTSELSGRTKECNRPSIVHHFFYDSYF